MPAFLIVRLGSLGDIVHALPVAAALRRALPSARIDWIVEAPHRPLLDLVPAIDRRITLTRGWTGAPLVVPFIAGLRRSRYDAALDLQGLIKSAVLARASGARRVVGFPREYLREPAARVFYTETAHPGTVPHVVDKNLALLGALGIEDRERRFPLDRTDSRVADQVRAIAGADDGGRFAVLNPGAAWPNKRWPAERFGELAVVLRDRNGLPSVVLWGPGEEPLARRVAEASKGTAVVAPPTTIADLVAVARAAALFVSGDTGPLHVAAACGTPIVGIYGPTSPARNGPWWPDDVTVSRFRECQCHHQRRCHVRRWCLSDLTTAEVAAAADRRLAVEAAHA